MKRRAALELTREQKKARKDSQFLRRTSRGLGTSQANLPQIQIARKSGMNPEKKMVDSNASLSLNNTGTGSGHTGLLNGLLLGTEMYQRIGRKVNVKSINIRCWVTKVAAQTVVADFFRFALIWDEQPTGALPAFADIWQTIDNAGTTAANIQGHANINNTARFRILRSHDMTVDTYTANVPYDNKVVTNWDWNVKMNTITQYNAGSTGAVTDIATGALYMVAHGISSATAVFNVAYSCRLKYQD